MRGWIPKSIGYGRYRVTGEIGSGQVTVVLDVVDTFLQVRRAAKVLLASNQSSSTLRQHQIQQARVMSNLRHPHIVGFYDAFADPDVGVVLVMERIDGVSLRDLLHTDGRLAPPFAVGALCDALSGLEAAHAEGILHRDFRPGHILMDDRGRARLIEFTGRRLGDRAPGGSATAQFTAPEQRRGNPSRAADIYAAGASLYALLTGASPRELDHVSHDPTHATWAELPPELARIIQCACASNPGARYASAGMLRAALMDALRRHEKRSPSIPPYRALP